MEAEMTQNQFALVSGVFSFDAMTGVYNGQLREESSKNGLSMDLWYKDDILALGAIMWVQQKGVPILSKDVWKRIAQFILPKQLLSLCRLPKTVIERAIKCVNQEMEDDDL